VYVPSGSSGTERQAAKMRFLAVFYDYIANLLLDKNHQYIVCGDFNIAHRAIDLKNWKQNQKNSGFLPEEREWFDGFLALGLVDVARELWGPERAVYSWWSQRGAAWQNDVGWRLDYQLATPMLAKTAHSPVVWRDERFSDHAMVGIEYTISNHTLLSS
jgi:exodeoxyribonuclease III